MAAPSSPTKARGQLVHTCRQLLAVLQDELEGKQHGPQEQPVSSPSLASLLDVDWRGLEAQVEGWVRDHPDQAYSAFQHAVEGAVHAGLARLQDHLATPTSRPPVTTAGPRGGADAATRATNHDLWVQALDFQKLATRLLIASTPNGTGPLASDAVVPPLSALAEEPFVSKPLHFQKYALSMPNPNGTLSFSSCNVVPFQPELIPPVEAVKVLKVIPSRLPMPPVPLTAVSLAPQFKMGAKRPSPTAYLWQEPALPDNRDYGHFVAFGPTHDASKATVTVAEAALLKRPRLHLDITPTWRGEGRKEGEAMPVPDFAQVFGATTTIRTTKEPLPRPPVRDAPALLADLRAQAKVTPAAGKAALVVQNTILLQMLQAYQDARMRHHSGGGDGAVSTEERLARDWLVANLSQLVASHPPRSFTPGAAELMEVYVGERRPQYRGQLPVDTRKFPVFASNRNMAMEPGLAGSVAHAGKAATGGRSGGGHHAASPAPGAGVSMAPNFHGSGSVPSSVPATPVPGLGGAPRPIVNVVAQPPPPPVFLSIPTTALHK